ncbi:MFS transporter [Sporolactobacillus shoreicorticis]|uniref:MFS transporter n=1 Tax=Sporolactobacillus shoreicorticis TaxID=1923877 RepID=A0ABW5S5F5_9BACL|nr:MFS transporter [Sporolactobacillus shoreicorticis]MCO7128295.1 MFS transporter [Sporolactobacillus shoreicorticis]
MSRTKNNLFLATFINYLAIYITMPVLVPISKIAYLSPSQTGLMVSVGSLSMMLGGPLWGKLSDTLGRKKIMITGMLGVGITYVLYIALFGYSMIQGQFVMTAFVFLILGRIVLGIFLPAMPSAGNALMADITDQASRAKGMALLGFATGLAMVLGPVIGGLLSGLGSLFIPFYMTIAISVLTGLYLIKALPRTEPVGVAGHEKIRGSKVFSFQLISWLLLGCSTMLVMVMVQLVMPLLLHDVFGYSNVSSAGQASILFFVMGTALIVTQILQMKVLNWQPTRLIIVGTIFMIAALLIMAFTHSYLLFAASFIFVGASLAFGLTAMSAGCSLCVSKEHQGIVSGIVAMTQGISGIVAPILGTVLYEINYVLPFYVFLAIIIAAFITFIISRAADKAEEPAFTQ